MRSPGAVLDVTATLSSAMVPAMATTTWGWKSVPALDLTCLLCGDELYARIKPIRTRHVCFVTRASHAEPECDTREDQPSAREIRYTTVRVPSTCTRTVRGRAGVVVQYTVKCVKWDRCMSRNRVADSPTKIMTLQPPWARLSSWVCAVLNPRPLTMMFEKVERPLVMRKQVNWRMR
jgi:hypothetical protein